MDLELLGWAKAMVRDLYQHQRLSLQTLMALQTLDRQQKKDFWNYLYPLWDPLMLRPPFCIPVRQIERLATDPFKMELLSAGVGFVDDLRWGGSALPVLRAAALGGSWEVVELALSRVSEFYLTRVELCLWATRGGHLELLKKGLQMGVQTHTDIMLREAVQHGYTHIVKFLLESSYSWKFDLREALELSFDLRDPALVKVMLDRRPPNEILYFQLAMACLKTFQQNLQVLKLLILPSFDALSLGRLLEATAVNQTPSVVSMLLKLGGDHKDFLMWMDGALKAAFQSGNEPVWGLLCSQPGVIVPAQLGHFEPNPIHCR